MFLYLHIPFCRQKCPYCKFALSPFVEELKIAQYAAFLRNEIREFFELSSKWIPCHPEQYLRHPERSRGIFLNRFLRSLTLGRNDESTGGSEQEKQQMIESIYFGGGTPSVLSVTKIKEILDCFPKDRFAGNIEITIEANPEDIMEEWALGVRNLGVNRLSLGIQSLNDMTLETVRRGGSAGIFRALEILKITGWDNVNVDFILGLPHTKSGETLAAIRSLHAKFPNIRHTSVYFLEKGDYPKEWKGFGISEAEATEEYARIIEFLTKERGFEHYEISNFALPGYESRHNRAYWTHENVRGFGLSAASFSNGRRFENAASFSGYSRSETIHEEVLSFEQLRIEKIMFGLRTFSLDPSLVADPETLDGLVRKGYLEYAGSTIRPTPAWIFILDHIMGELV